MILVDSSVLIDVIEAKPDWKHWSAAQLDKLAGSDGLAINAIIYAEIARTFASAESQNGFLNAVGIRVLPIPNEAAFAASRAHLAYRAVGGYKTSTLPDFFIGAHADFGGYSLLTRDAKRIRTYFPRVTLITPE